MIITIDLNRKTIRLSGTGDIDQLISVLETYKGQGFQFESEMIWDKNTFRIPWIQPVNPLENTPWTITSTGGELKTLKL